VLATKVARFFWSPRPSTPGRVVLAGFWGGRRAPTDEESPLFLSVTAVLAREALVMVAPGPSLLSAARKR